jgi:hypothetical protein
MKIKKIGGIRECIVDLFFRPNIECAFGCLMAGIIDSYNGAVGVLG